MANTKEYKIVINGITESVKAVESLNKELNELEARIKALEGKSVGVKTSGGGGGSSSSKASLSEEEKLAKQIEQIDAKRVAYSKEIYQNYLAAKDVLKETVTDQKSIAAAERLQANSYSNTIQGMKQELADIKSAMQTVDLGDTDKMDAMVKRANELNEALKKIEESYGQFGRNVGNYASAAEGFSKYKVVIEGVTREFNSAKEAAKVLSNELLNLPKGAKGADELREAIHQIKSDIQDIQKSSQTMDHMLDTMESFAAIANVGQGIRGLFGVNDAEMQKSIKNLVALQNILKGIETINKQINTREGIGAWIAPFNKGIDAATQKALVFNRALLGTNKAAKAAAVGIKAFSKALKVALSAGVLVVVDVLVEKLMDLVESFKKVDDAADDVKDAQDEITKAYANATAKIKTYQARVKSFNGTQEQEKNLVKELNSELGNSLGTYDSIAKWMDVLVQKGDAYIQMLKLQAKAQAAFNLYVKQLEKEQDLGEKTIEDFEEWWQKLFPSSWTVKTSNKARVAAHQAQKASTKAAEDEMLKAQKELDDFKKKNGIGEYAPQVTTSGNTKTKQTVKKNQSDLTDLEISLMRDGLGKKLRQLDEEERQTINKIRENGRKSADEIEKVQRLYAAKRKQEIDEYLKNLENDIKQSARNIENTQFDINISKLKNSIDEIENEIKQFSLDQPIKNTLISKTETKDIKTTYRVDDSKLYFAKRYNQLLNESKASDDINEFYKFLTRYIKEKDKELFKDVEDFNNAIYNEPDESKKEAYFKGLENTYNKVSDIIEQEYANELLYIRDYTDKTDQTLSDSLDFRLKSEEEYNESIRAIIAERLKEQADLNKQLIEQETSAATKSENDRYEIQNTGLEKQRDAAKKTMEAIEKQYKFSGIKEAEILDELNKDKLKKYKKAYSDYTSANTSIETAQKQHEIKLEEITKEGNNKLKNNEIEAAKTIATEQEKLFDNQIQNIRDAQSKISELLSKQPVVNKLGIVNISATKKQYKEIVDATKKMTNEIIIQKAKLNALWAAGLIKPEAMNAIKQQLNDLEQAFKQLFQQIESETNDTMPKFIQSCQVYVQGALDSFQTIMNEVWNAQDTAFDKEQEQLDKANDELDKKLDEQQDIVQQHKSAIDSIEDELATARGDRRQHLIDQLNAEMAAQRAAQKQEQKIQKEKEAAQKKQDALDKKRKKAQYQRDMLQAIVNGAMAVTYAAMNAWPVPAIPMMALAAATTAAQVAIMASNKPYAKGGVLEGPSHKQGGIPVGNTGIEVEGKEYVIRKKSTTPNVELLDMINRSERKLNLDDFIDFYTSGKIKKNISAMSPRTRFAEGGTIPTITNDYSFDDRLISAFEDYSNRPVVVAVTDINNRQAAVKNVQVLAGLPD